MRATFRIGRRGFFWWVLLTGGGIAHSATATTAYQEGPPVERVSLQLSASVTAAGTTVWMQGILNSEAKSTVLYVEVMNRHGAVWQGVYPVHQRIAQGSIALPDTLTSGWYQVRAYTQAMRNLGAASFTTRPLLVVNPYQKTTSLASPPSGPAEASASVPPLSPEIAVTLNRSTYHPRDSVAVRIHWDTPLDTARMAVSVRRAYPLEQLREVEPAVSSGFSGNVLYPVEDEGLTVSGRVQEQQGTARGRMVTLSIPGSDPYFQYTFVDSAGRFHLSVAPDRQGTQNVILQMSDTSLRVQWTLDEKFAPENTYPTASFPPLADSVWQAWQAACAQRTQIHDSYALPDDSVTIPLLKHARFYGSPNYEIILDEYTPLPTFLEVNRELLVAVRLRQRRGRYDMDVFDIPNRTFLEGEPSVFMDGVLVHDLNYLVNFPPDQIVRIETVNRRTYYGEYRLDGTVAVYTRSGNSYEPALQPSALSKTLDLYRPPRPFTAPKRAPHEPDLRTLLHWQPGIVLSGDSLTVSFANADELGEFEVVVEGITRDGRPVSGRQSYMVLPDETP